MFSSVDQLPVIQGDKVLDDLLEKKRRRLIRGSLDEWARLCGWQPATHHRYINAVLEKVEAGLVRKVIITLPAGAAKSTYSSVQFPPWYLAKGIGRQILACSHRDDLVTSFGRRGRELIKLHSKILGYKLKQDSAAVDHWETSNGGIYQGAGTGAGIAGIRADLGLIDDYFGKKEDAESETMRKKIISWYQWDFMRRLKPKAAQVIIATRWHEEDLIGWLLKHERDEWLLVDIPLNAKEGDVLGRAKGELLWPEYFDAEFEREAKKDPNIYNCVFQNDPTPESGNYFEREWIQTYEPSELPKNLRMYACSDHALSKRQEADSTCMPIAGMDANENLYILADMPWDKMATDKQVDEMLRMNKQYKPITWWAGKEHITGSMGPFLNKRMVEERNYIPLVETTSSKDLVARAQPLKGRMRTRKVFFPAKAEWWPRALKELLAFPMGAHDDFIAALSELGRGLDEMYKPAPESQPEETLEALVNKPWRPTMAWVKESDRRKKREERIAYMDN